MKEIIQKMKEDIKAMASQQKVLKANRKTEHIKVERTVPAWEATYKARSNKYQLRHMYLAYAILRGQDLNKVETNSKEPYNESYVNRLVTQYDPNMLHTQIREAS